MLPAALELFTRSRADGWNRDGAPGFVYTVDFVGTPVVHERMHWVTCEAISAAAALHCALVNEPVPLAAKATSMAYLEHAYRSAWDYCEQYIIGGGDPFTRAEIDPQNAPLDQAGAWVHELDQVNQPSTRTWAGYPDIYHFDSARAGVAGTTRRTARWPVRPLVVRDKVTRADRRKRIRICGVCGGPAGEVTERPNVTVLKTVVSARAPGVRIPSSPPAGLKIALLERDF